MNSPCTHWVNDPLPQCIFVLLEASPQQDTLFPLPVNILPVTIHLLLMFSVHPGDLILQVVDDGLQLFDLPLQSHHLAIVVVDLEGQIRVSTKKLLGFPPPMQCFHQLISTAALP